ncbi:hypothetical protein GY45DRAFT_208039 [Cubamyces sp. BRFM 1775]|nr:hypothetical protein GY45DRAFT_208039 [Cubamyces sp. BRFM 1775]
MHRCTLCRTVVSVIALGQDAPAARRLRCTLLRRRCGRCMHRGSKTRSLWPATCTTDAEFEPQPMLLVLSDSDSDSHHHHRRNRISPLLPSRKHYAGWRRPERSSSTVVSNCQWAHCRQADTISSDGRSPVLGLLHTRRTLVLQLGAHSLFLTIPGLGLGGMWWATQRSRTQSLVAAPRASRCGPPGLMSARQAVHKICPPLA